MKHVCRYQVISIWVGALEQMDIIKSVSGNFDNFDNDFCLNKDKKCQTASTIIMHFLM